MRVLKKLFMGAFVVLILIQFIRPARNRSSQLSPFQISHVVAVPNNVNSLLSNACYDCHSNNTRYPWYANVQPMGWLLADHIKDGKAELNFDEFGSYSKRRQLSKLKAIAGSIKDGSMPIASYTWLHRVAKLSPENKASIIEWANRSKNSLEIKN